jgi:hypothetical protein
MKLLKACILLTLISSCSQLKQNNDEMINRELASSNFSCTSLFKTIIGKTSSTPSVKISDIPYNEEVFLYRLNQYGHEYLAAVVFDLGTLSSKHKELENLYINLIVHFREKKSISQIASSLSLVHKKQLWKWSYQFEDTLVDDEMLKLAKAEGDEVAEFFLAFPMGKAREDAKQIFNQMRVTNPKMTKSDIINYINKRASKCLL